MKIVIDSNRIIAALLKDSTTREIIFNKNFEFIAPSYIFSEIDKYKNYIIQKANIEEENFDVLLSLIFEKVKIINELEYSKFLKELEGEIRDTKDIPYLALSLASKSIGIWTHDPHFKEQNKVRVYSNIDMLKLIKRKN